MSDDAMVICDTRAKLAELERLLPGALVERLIEVFGDSIRRKAASVIAEGVADERLGL